MTDRKPSDDLKEGLSLLFRAARGAAKEVSKELDTAKVEQAINTGARELARTIENVGKSLSNELDKTFKDQGPDKDEARKDEDRKDEARKDDKAEPPRF
jgi:hypothetical protein